jgi:RsiW-degrading membrane proteinase PrsW (M82 family)
MTSPTFTPPVPEPPARPARPRLRRWLWRAVVTTVLLLCGLASLLAIGTATGPVGFVVGVVLGAIPVLVVVAAFLWLDRYEAEPTSLLLFAFGWGAAVATLVALLLNSASVVVLQDAGGDPDLASVVVAPFVEETAKGLGVLAVLLARRREFDGVVDGIVYAGLVGIGFAFVENVLYLGRAYGEAGGGGAAGVFVLRGLFSPFAHSLFTMAIGVGLGLAASRGTTRARVVAPLAGWAVAVALHAAWNLSALSGLQGFLSAYLLFQVPIFVGAVVLAVLARRREGRLLARHLGVYATSGWLTPAEVSMLSRLPERRAARAWATRTLGPDAGRAMRDFTELGSELAFLRERMSHGTAAEDARQVEQRLLATMWHLRPRFLPRVVLPRVVQGSGQGSTERA